MKAFSQKQFKKLFSDNYFETKEFANLMKELLGKIETIKIGNQSYNVYNNKIISWQPINKNQRKLLKKKKIQY